MSLSWCYMFCLSHYFHISLPYFASVVLCSHVSSMFCLPHTMSTSHLHLAAMYSVCHVIPTSHYIFFSPSHYVHTSVPCSGSVILCPWCSTIFYPSHIMLLSDYHILPLLLYAHIYDIFSCFKHVLKGKYSTKVWNPRILYVCIYIF